MKHTDRMTESAKPSASRGLPDPALRADEGSEDKADSKDAAAVPERRLRQLETGHGDRVVRLAPRALRKPREALHAPNGMAPTGDDDDPGPAAA